MLIVTIYASTTSCMYSNYLITYLDMTYIVYCYCIHDYNIGSRVYDSWMGSEKNVPLCCVPDHWWHVEMTVFVLDLATSADLQSRVSSQT